MEIDKAWSAIQQVVTETTKRPNKIAEHRQNATITSEQERIASLRRERNDRLLYKWISHLF